LGQSAARSTCPANGVPFAVVAEDLFATLLRFHREIVLPDVQRLETEYQMVVAGLRRLEDRMDRVEARPRE
jgi:hypothetical protein